MEEWRRYVGDDVGSIKVEMTVPNFNVTSRGDTGDKEFTRETHYADEYSELSFGQSEEIPSAERVSLAHVTSLNFNFHASYTAI